MEQKKLYAKKGQIAGTMGAVVSLIIGVGIAALVMIFVGTLTGQTYNIVEPDINTLSTGVTDETITVINSTAVAMANDDIVSGSITVKNLSNTVANSKFTFDLDDGTTTLLDNAFNNTPLNFSYAHGNAAVENSIKNSIVSSFNGFEQIGMYFPIIVLAVIIMLVLALVMGFSGIASGGNGNGGAL